MKKDKILKLKERWRYLKPEDQARDSDDEEPILKQRDPVFTKTKQTNFHSEPDPAETSCEYDAKIE